MLSLGRNPGEYVVINGNIVIQVVMVDGALKLAIDAPREIAIERGEYYEQNHPIPNCILHTRSLGSENGRVTRRKKM